MKRRFLQLFGKESGEPRRSTGSFRFLRFASHSFSSAEHRCQRTNEKASATFLRLAFPISNVALRGVLSDVPVLRLRQRPFADAYEQFQTNRKRIVSQRLTINHARPGP
jgi:hypothetical protein